MPWFRVDDKLHDHRKSRRAGLPAMGLWVLAGSWSMDHLTDGFVPKDVLPRWATLTIAKRLVAAGLWETAEQDGETGWRFLNWEEFQPSKADVEAERTATRERVKRWREGRTNKPSNSTGNGVTNSASTDSPTRPDPTHEDADASSTPVTAEAATPTTALAVVDRPDVERLCIHLADRIEANGANRPTITGKWRDAARLMLDRDQRTEAQITAAIDWCQDDEFWRSNVLSMPKLREQYEQLRLQATRRQTLRPTRQQETDGIFERAAARMGVTS